MKRFKVFQGKKGNGVGVTEFQLAIRFLTDPAVMQGVIWILQLQPRFSFFTPENKWSLAHYELKVRMQINKTLLHLRMQIVILSLRVRESKMLTLTEESPKGLHPLVRRGHSYLVLVWDLPLVRKSEIIGLTKTHLTVSFNYLAKLVLFVLLHRQDFVEWCTKANQNPKVNN